MRTRKEANISMKAKDCLGSLISLYNVVKSRIKEIGSLSVGNIENNILNLLYNVSNLESENEAKRKVFISQPDTRGEIDYIEANIDGSIVSISEKNIYTMYKSFDILRKDIAINSLSDDCSCYSVNHFILTSEKREIITEFASTNCTDMEINSDINESLILRNINKSLEHGASVIETNNLIVKTNHHRFFTVKPGSEFARKILRDKFECDVDKSNSMNIPDLLHDSWLNFETIVASILVHYQFIFSDYSRIKICGSCGNMYIQNRSDSNYCSKKCSQIGWARRKENDTYEMIKCRERQKQFFNYKEKTILQWLKEDCIGCSRKPLPPGGRCTRWKDKFGEEEIDRRLAKHGVNSGV